MADDKLSNSPIQPLFRRYLSYRRVSQYPF